MADLPVPDLDDLRFQPLVDAAKRALPQRVPQWTDHNVSDPGVTLLEACAERVDQLLYRVGRMTARQRAALLRLMGIGPLPASPGRLLVAFSRTGTAAAGDLQIPAGTEVSTEESDPVVLQTAEPLTIPADQITGTVEAVEKPVLVKEVLGVSDGRPGQRFAPGRRPWRPGTPGEKSLLCPPVAVSVGGITWEPVSTFGQAVAGSRVHWWDDASGEVVFGPLVPGAQGDEQLGAVPPAGTSIGAEYCVYRGSRAGLPAGTLLSAASPSGLSAVVHGVVADPQDAEEWQQALYRAGLGMAPLRRAVTAADYEQILDEHIDGLARIRVTALTRPTDSRMPEALRTPRRPVDILACLLAAQQPDRVVHYHVDGSGDVTALRLPLGPVAEESTEEDAVPSFVNPKTRLDAVVRIAQEEPRLWFFGDQCGWDGADPRPVGEEFPGLPEEFCEDLDAVTVLSDSPGTCELFFFKGESFYHRAYTYSEGSFKPAAGGRGVKSLISEAFPGLTPHCQESPDAVVVVDGVFYFLKGARTESALWRREDAPIRVLLVPTPSGDPADATTRDAFSIPADTLSEVERVLEEARPLGERLSITPPRYHSFGVKATVSPWSSAPAGSEQTREAATRALRRYFHPTAGGPEGRGWPWGRPVHAGDVFTALEAVPDVLGTTQVTLADGDSQGELSSIEVSDSGLVLLEDVEITVAIHA
ncbi:hypothetical protein [Streptomyces sp. NPDC054765]